MHSVGIWRTKPRGRSESEASVWASVRTARGGRAAGRGCWEGLSEGGGPGLRRPSAQPGSSGSGNEKSCVCTDVGPWLGSPESRGFGVRGGRKGVLNKPTKNRLLNMENELVVTMGQVGRQMKEI